MINSRRKGAAGELEFSDTIEKLTGVKLVRNLEQSRSGGCDLILAPEQNTPIAQRLDRYSIECKRYKQITNGGLSGFWKQAVNQAGGKVPLLAARADRSEWQIVLPLSELTGQPVDNSFKQIAIITPEGFSALLQLHTDLQMVA